MPTRAKSLRLLRSRHAGMCQQLPMGRQPRGPIVRRGTPEDADAIAELVERVDRARFQRTESEWTATRNRLRRVLADEAIVTFVAEQDGELVGELLGVPRAPGVVGIGLSVAEDSRRRGVATALFAAAEAWAREAGVGELRLDVQEANAPARALYEKLGFVDAGLRRTGESGPILTMSKRL